MIKVIFECGGCNATETVLATQVVDGLFSNMAEIKKRGGFVTKRTPTIEELLPIGWCQYCWVGATYCPKCWADINKEVNP